MHIINTLIPILLILLFGAGLAKWGFLNLTFQRDLNRLTYYFGLPALIVEKLATADFQGQEALPVFLALASATVGTILIGLTVAWLLRLPGETYGTFLQATFRGNLAYIGIPLLVYVVSDVSHTSSADVLAIALLVLAPMMIVYNTLSVAALLASHHRFGWEGLKQVAFRIVKNPLILASVAGTALSIQPWSLPSPLHRSLETIGQMAVPIALLSIGGSLATTNLGDRLGAATAAAVLKVLAVPLLAFGIGQLFNITPLGFKVLMVFSACPTAVASYIMAVEMNGEGGLASSSIVLSTVLSAVSLGIVIGLF